MLHAMRAHRRSAYGLPRPLPRFRALCNSSKETLYDILGVSRLALTREIKSAYMQAAKRVHPDRNPSPAAKEEFQRLSQAYRVLNNPATRRQYDEDGSGGEDARASEAAHRAAETHVRRDGARSDYQSWKRELFASFTDATWRSFGIRDHEAYVAQMRGHFDLAVAAARGVDEDAAARGHTRDFGPARSFATQYRPWLLAGAAVTLMASPTVPFMLFVSARIVTKLDQNADWLLAWCEGRLRWSPWQAGQRKLAAWARAVKAELRARMTM